MTDERMVRLLAELDDARNEVVKLNAQLDSVDELRNRLRIVSARMAAAEAENFVLRDNIWRLRQVTGGGLSLPRRIVNLGRRVLRKIRTLLLGRG